MLDEIAACVSTCTATAATGRTSCSTLSADAAAFPDGHRGSADRKRCSELTDPMLEPDGRVNTFPSRCSGSALSRERARALPRRRSRDGRPRRRPVAGPLMRGTAPVLRRAGPLRRGGSGRSAVTRTARRSRASSPRQPTGPSSWSAVRLGALRAARRHPRRACGGQRLVGARHPRYYPGRRFAPRTCRSR